MSDLSELREQIVDMDEIHERVHVGNGVGPVSDGSCRCCTAAMRKRTIRARLNFPMTSDLREQAYKD